jgi:hypothetical protein
MVVERERPPVVQPDDLERAVAAQQPLVRGGDADLVRGHDRAVEDREHARRLAQRRTPKATETPSSSRPSSW